MCLAIPGKIKRIEETKAYFNFKGRDCSADITLSPEVAIGDWILVHDGRALSKITEAEAKENLEFIKTHDEMTCANHKH